ncbi:MAG TPA: hypothetical protein VFM88_02535 [Vicinamibacteria bacterium]|nr:hypothetical protein [Vicinamibacteria bacterium]
MRHPVLVSATGLIALLAFCSAGCTLVGLGVGSVADSKSDKQRQVSRWWEPKVVSTGAKVEVRTRDGRVLEGRFAGLEPRKAAEYANAVQERAALGEDRPPTLGPGARLRKVGGKEADCEILGFDPGTIHVQLPGQAQASSLAVDTIEDIVDPEGRSIKGSALQSLMEAGRVPFSRTLAVDTAEGRSRINLEDVSRVSVRGTSKGKTTGIIVGAAIDAVVIAALMADSSGGSSTTTGTESSCPFFHSFDGTRYVLDAEPFSGATMEAAQRTDFARLDHLREVDGEYRLRVTNELEEIEYLDEVKLLVVDHPEGTAVAPDPFGGVHVLDEIGRPVAARDLSGADVRDLVSAEDEQPWVANPLGHDPDDVKGGRDGLVLEFERPRGETRARVAVRARGTPAGPALVRRFLSLHGSDLEAWYGRVGRDRALQGSLDRLQMEAVPVLRLWDGERWRPMAYVTAALPTVVWTTQAASLDLRESPGERLRLRIDGPPGTWSIDAVVVAFGESGADPVSVTVLEARTPRDADGPSAAREALRAADGRRHVLPRAGVLDLAFDAPARPVSGERSFVLKATGYYSLILDPLGEPQEALLEELLREPTALGRFAVALAREEARSAAPISAPR